MALFTDGPAASIEDLQALDSAIFETSRTENISLPGKLDIARQAIELELSVFLLRTARLDVAGEADIRRVVVTPGMRRWHALRTLAEVYGDAYSSQLNDRYLGKWKSFRELSKETAELLMELGVGVVRNPVPKASPPTVRATSGSGGIETYAIRVCWRNAFGEAGATSDPVILEASDVEVPEVSVGLAPAGCIGWDVYIGTSPDSTIRQNESPIHPASTWSPAGSVITSGTGPSTGQSPEYFIRRRRTF